MANGWTDPSDKILDDGLHYQDVDEIYGDLKCLKEFPKGVSFGGDPKMLYIATSYTIIEDPIYREIGSTQAVGATYELHFMGMVTAADTGYVQLWDITNSVQLVEKTFTNTTLDLVKSTSFTLPTSSAKCRIEVKATTGGVSSPFKAYGFFVIQK